MALLFLLLFLATLAIYPNFGPVVDSSHVGTDHRLAEGGSAPNRVTIGYHDAKVVFQGFNNNNKVWSLDFCVHKMSFLQKQSPVS